uniref:Uncharacterized protein n=1 Tax=viral metagenome TaxID=1070528 RepID=A0A6C0LJA0_9ZZZZ
MPLYVLFALVVIGCIDCHWLLSFALNALIVLFAIIVVYAMIGFVVCLDYLP